MSRPVLSLARASKPTIPPLSLVKKALRLFRGRGIDKATRRRNALAWVAVRERMGNRHVLKGHPVSWGNPGQPYTTQVFAPRRQGGK
jgi:hypothetical protein